MFKTKLFIFGKEYNVLEFTTDINQQDDGTGLPITRTYGGKLNITIPAPKDVVEFFTVAISSRQMVNGYVRFYQRDGLHKHKDWEFANTYMLHFHESFNYKDNKTMTCNIILSPGILRVNGFVYENEWNPSNPFDQQAIPISNTDDSEPLLLNYHIEDLEGNSIQKNKIKKNQEIYLVINSENAEGKAVEINLDNKSIDFEYNGKWMKDDIINNITLSSKTTRIKLKAVKQKQ